MEAPERDAAFLWDMLTSAREIQQFITGLTKEQYLQDRVRQLAVERVVEIIAEAARQVSAEFQDAHPQISWRGIIAQRHVLAHDYGSIDHERIWRVATVHVNELISHLEPLVPQPPPSLEE